MSLKSNLKEVKRAYKSVRRYVPLNTVKGVADTITGGRVTAVIDTAKGIYADYKKVDNAVDLVKSKIEDVSNNSNNVQDVSVKGVKMQYNVNSGDNSRGGGQYNVKSGDNSRGGGLLDWILNLF